jgi:hypothetical protein
MPLLDHDRTAADYSTAREAAELNEPRAVQIDRGRDVTFSVPPLTMALKPTAPELVSNKPPLPTFAPLSIPPEKTLSRAPALMKWRTGNCPVARICARAASFRPSAPAIHRPRWLFCRVKASLTTRCACTLYPPMLPYEGRLRWAKGGEQEWDNRESRSVRSSSTGTRPRSHLRMNSGMNCATLPPNDVFR